MLIDLYMSVYLWFVQTWAPPLTIGCNVVPLILFDTLEGCFSSPFFVQPRGHLMCIVLHLYSLFGLVACFSSLLFLYLFTSFILWSTLHTLLSPTVVIPLIAHHISFSTLHPLNCLFHSHYQFQQLNRSPTSHIGNGKYY